MDWTLTPSPNLAAEAHSVDTYVVSFILSLTEFMCRTLRARNWAFWEGLLPYAVLQD